MREVKLKMRSKNGRLKYLLEQIKATAEGDTDLMDRKDLEKKLRTVHMLAEISLWPEIKPIKDTNQLDFNFG
jgi:hypothetical protein